MSRRLTLHLAAQNWQASNRVIRYGGKGEPCTSCGSRNTNFLYFAQGGQIHECFYCDREFAVKDAPKTKA